jgi:threonylcarbamoyladenosine tRNA methylthiotransferase MtaB
MFARSLDLIDECGLTQLHVFPFSSRPGTPAARMPQVARPVVKDRAARLRRKGADALRRHLEREVGQRRSVLVESQATGRTEHFLPIRVPDSLPIGAICGVTVVDQDGQWLNGLYN